MINNTKLYFHNNEIFDFCKYLKSQIYIWFDLQGFKAEVSREPTNIHVKIPTPAPQTASPAPQYRLPERKPQPQQYITVQVRKRIHKQKHLDSLQILIKNNIINKKH